MSGKTSIGIVIVSHGHERFMNRLIDAINRQRRPGDRVVILDNHPDHKAADIAERLAGVDYVMRSPNNGFGAACREGGAAVIDEVGLLYFLNPDTRPLPHALDEIRKGLESSYGAWMSLLVLPDGKVNSAGNIVHMSGLSWCDAYGKSGDDFTGNRRVTVLSGACLAVRSDIWLRHKGMEDKYFLYYEDTDLSTRLLLVGVQLGLLANSRVEHDYDFGKSRTKWFYLERNRLLYIVRTWPWPVLLLLLPELTAVELGLWLVSIVQRRFLLKARSLFSAVRCLPWALRTRRTIQAGRSMSSAAFLQTLEPVIDTPLLGMMSGNRLIDRIFTWYRALALGVLGLFPRR